MGPKVDDWGFLQSYGETKELWKPCSSHLSGPKYSCIRGTSNELNWLGSEWWDLTKGQRYPLKLRRPLEKELRLSFEASMP